MCSTLGSALRSISVSSGGFTPGMHPAQPLGKVGRRAGGREGSCLRDPFAPKTMWGISWPTSPLFFFFLFFFLLPVLVSDCSVRRHGRAGGHLCWGALLGLERKACWRSSCWLLSMPFIPTSVFLLGLTLESPPPLPHSPLSYHHLFFNLSKSPCSFSFNTARFTGFL